MDNEKKGIDIALDDLYSLSTAMGLMSRVFVDWDQALFAEAHELAVPGLLVSTLLLDKRIGGDFFRVAWISYLDIVTVRKLLPNTPKVVAWPLWDETTLAHPDLKVLYDLCIMLAAWNFAARQDEYPPEDFLGPLFSLSGVIAEGVSKGYCLEEERLAKAYQEQRVKLASEHGSKEEFEEALRKQIESIASTLEMKRAGLRN